MNTLLSFVLGTILFSGGGMHGRLGSVLAAFIVPDALVETSSNNNQQTPPPPQYQVPKGTPGLNGNPGAPPPTLPPQQPGNVCPQGYLYSPSTKLCMSLQGI